MIIRTCKNSVFAIILLSSIIALPTFSASVPGVFNTGVNNSGVALGDRVLDPHWTLTTSADPTYDGPETYTVKSDEFPIPPWMANTSISKWICPRQDATQVEPGTYVYQLQFDLTDYDPQSAQITGRFSSDDKVDNVKINGMSTGINGVMFDTWHSFLISTGFTAGMNTLEFFVINTGTSANPSGFRVELAITADIAPPEAINPNPANSANGVAVDTDISWTPGYGACSHDLYFGTDFSDVNEGMRLPTDINGDKIVDLSDVEALGSQIAGPPGCPYPADLDDDNDVDLIDYAIFAEEYLQECNDPAFVGTFIDSQYDIDTLEPNKIYYWRVDERKPNNIIYGDIWNFDTISATIPDGSLVVDHEHPAWLKYHNEGPLFMCGPGDPEDFLYRGTRNADGTRTGDQMTLINKMVGTGANCIYFQAVKTHGGDGDSTMNPFVNSNVNGLLDEDILDQWETWFTAMDANDIVIFFMFYDDYSSPYGSGLMGGELPAQEAYMIDAIVNRFEHHKHLIWIVSEEYQKALTAARVSKIAERIKMADDFDHPVGTHQLPGTSFDFNSDDNMDQFAMQLNDATTSYVHSSCVAAWNNVGGLKNVNLAEIYEFNTIPQTGAALRQKAWAAAMGGAYSMWLWMDIASTPVSDLQICGRLVGFMESTRFYETQPYDSLARGNTDYVLADPGNVYIVYGDSGTSLGVNIIAGNYFVKWFDPVDGDWVDEGSQTLTAGDNTFTKPGAISSEAALYLELDDGWSYGVEAENYDTQVGAGTWTLQTSTSGYVGTGYMGDTRTDLYDPTSSLKYDIDFPSAGTYYCYLRNWASDSLNNGFHLEFDGVRLSTQSDSHGTREAVYATKQSIWNWATQWQYGEGDVEGPLDIVVNSAGTHTLAIVSRDPGFRFDRIIVVDYKIGGLNYSTGTAPAFLNELETIPNGYQ